MGGGAEQGQPGGTAGQGGSGPSQKPSRGRRRIAKALLVGGVITVVTRPGIRDRLLDAVFGPEEEFEYESETDPAAIGITPLDDAPPRSGADDDEDAPAAGAEREPEAQEPGADAPEPESEPWQPEPEPGAAAEPDATDFGRFELGAEPQSEPESEPPAVEQPAPWAVSESEPTVERPAPWTESEPPAVERPAPWAESEPPAVERPAPWAESEPPAVERPAPRAESEPPAVAEPAPWTESEPPAVEPPAPSWPRAAATAHPPQVAEPEPPVAEPGAAAAPAPALATPAAAGSEQAAADAAANPGPRRPAYESQQPVYEWLRAALQSEPAGAEPAALESLRFEFESKLAPAGQPSSPAVEPSEQPLEPRVSSSGGGVVDDDGPALRRNRAPIPPVAHFGGLHAVDPVRPPADVSAPQGVEPAGAAASAALRGSDSVAPAADRPAPDATAEAPAGELELPPAVDAAAPPQPAEQPAAAAPAPSSLVRDPDAALHRRAEDREPAIGEAAPRRTGWWLPRRRARSESEPPRWD